MRKLADALFTVIAVVSMAAVMASFILVPLWVAFIIADVITYFLHLFT